jgi:hypothetical protein
VVVFVLLVVMKRIRIRLRKTGVLLLFGLVATGGANAATGQSQSGPYHGIVERNVFDLRARLVVIKEPPVMPIPLPRIRLTGTMTILGREMACITIDGIKPGSPPESVMLAEGQAFSDVEVKNIDQKSGIVQVMNHGALQTLGFEAAGAKPSDSPGRFEPTGSTPPPQLPARSEASLSPEDKLR